MAIRLQDWLSRATEALAPVAEQPRYEARRLVEAALNWPIASQLADPDQTIDAASLDALDALLHRRAERHEPLSRILGRREFWGLSLEIEGVTLDPRPDTETLVELALDLFSGPERSPPGQILDLGTGSGALLLALLIEYPAAQGLGVDQDRDTLATAARNAARLGLGERARFEGGDWLSGVSGRFDLIVSNPPYIPTGDLAGLDRAARLRRSAGAGRRRGRTGVLCADTARSGAVSGTGRGLDPRTGDRAGGQRAGTGPRFRLAPAVAAG